MSFRIAGLDPGPFRHLRGLDDQALAAERARRVVVEREGGYPERIELRDATPGDRLLLVNYVHQPADTPFRASHAVFIREDADEPAAFIDAVPPVILRRLISLRAFDHGDELIDGDVVQGATFDARLKDYLARPEVAYLHAHAAKYGCFLARIERA